MVGMMTGLAYLQFFGFYLKVTAKRDQRSGDNGQLGDPVPFDIFQRLARAEWDTLLFFYGVVLSAIVDNIPVMFAVLTMNPDMPLGQWLLVTLTAFDGG